jgi:hypothetical protein
MTNNFDIGITTFSLRYHFIETLVERIRAFAPGIRIFICINGEKEGNFNEDYRLKMINLCSKYPNIFPIFFAEMRGLSKMWNTLIIHSVHDNMLVLNDDIIVEDSGIFDNVSTYIQNGCVDGIAKINGSFSHFVVNRLFIQDLGYFDERLLGFGEEDGDITFRVIEKYNRGVGEIHAGGVTNVVSDIRHTHVAPGVGKYSLYNRKFTFEEKYKLNEGHISGMFGTTAVMLSPSVSQYPYEKYFHENKTKV